jgi:hypothetical protein
MRNVYLPVEHTEADLVLAGQVAEILESGSLYVTWSPRGYELPRVEAAMRVVDGPVVAVRPVTVATHSLLAEVLGTLAAFVAGVFAARAHRAAAARGLSHA